MLLYRKMSHSGVILEDSQKIVFTKKLPHVLVRF